MGNNPETDSPSEKNSDNSSEKNSDNIEDESILTTIFNMVKEILNDQVEIKYKNDGYHNHYNFTPYSFEPSVSRKLSANPHIDMGQGLLECVRSVHKNEK